MRYTEIYSTGINFEEATLLTYHFGVLVVAGTLLTSLSGLLFAVINPSAPYWAFGFPAAVLSVFGADFVFASGSLFVARVSERHEQSLAGGLFQTVMQVCCPFYLSATYALRLLADYVAHRRTR